MCCFVGPSKQPFLTGGQRTVVSTLSQVWARLLGFMTSFSSSKCCVWIFLLTEVNSSDVCLRMFRP